MGRTLLSAAVCDLSFRIADGEVLGLVGESGSGKSVTSLALMRLLPPQARATGEIFYRNGSGPHNLLQLPDDDMRQLRGSRLAMTSRSHDLVLNPGDAVVDQIAELSWPTLELKEAHAPGAVAAMELMSPFPIPRAGTRLSVSTVGRMRKRVMIAMAIVTVLPSLIRR